MDVTHYSATVGYRAGAAVGIKPPSTEAAWRWMERNIVLDGSSVVPGRYSTELTPMVRFVAGEFQKRTLRRLVLMVSAQSAKTQLMLNLFNWTVNEDPGPSMWVMANADMMSEFLKKRLVPAVDNCALTAAKLPEARRNVEKGVILFDTMFLAMRGSNSRSKLQSDPIRNFFFDERREWKAGAIDLVRKRARTFHNSREISVGTAGVKDDELHSDWKEGSQTLFHWHCAKCGHSQPFRFGQRKSAIFADARDKGGVVFDLALEHDEAAFKASVRYECEKCAHRYTSADKPALLRTLHPVDYNPTANERAKSFQWNALYMPWPSCSFEDIAWEFVRARHQQQIGNEQPMIAFVTETLGEPMVNEREEQLAVPEIGDGKIEVSDEKFRVMTIDFQKRDFWYVIRAWWPDARSKMIAAGHVDNEDDLNRLRKEHRVMSMFTAMDSGFDAPTTYRICHKFGERWRGVWHPWKATKGERKDYYTETTRDGKRIRRLYQVSEARTGVRVPLWLIATTGCKDIVINLRDGKGAKWESLPTAALPVDYVDQLNSEEKVREYLNGREEAHYEKVSDRRRNEFLDCESNQIPICNWMGVFDVR